MTKGGKKTQLTDKQLAAIFSLARFRGMDQAAVVNLTREKFTREPGQLDRQQAAQLIRRFSLRQGSSIAREAAARALGGLCRRAAAGGSRVP